MLDLEDTIRSLEPDFLAAVQGGPRRVAQFCDRLDGLRCQLQLARDSGLLSPELGEIARKSMSLILTHATGAHDFVTSADEIIDLGSSDADPADTAPPRASLPLFEYFLSNICHPYPSSVEKDDLVEEVRRLGWHDFDRRRVEDWLNRRRHQCGFVAIQRKYCGVDHDAMRQLCSKALSGTSEEKASLAPGALEEIEDMRDVVQSLYDDLAEETDAVWVDELAAHISTVLVEDDDLSDDESDDALTDDEGSDRFTHDSASDCSSTDVDDDDEPARAIIGAKRKFADDDYSRHSSPRPLSRSASMTSSVGSGSTACTMRSFSGSSMSSMTSVEWEDENDLCGRPAKRSRTESCASGGQPSPAMGSPDAAPPTTTILTDPLFTSYRTKRKRTIGDLSSSTRSMKRSRYAALGVASYISSVPDAHLSSLSSLCALDWTSAEAVVVDFEPDSYTTDCSQPDDEGSDQEFAVLIDREDDQPTEDIATWSKLHIDALLRMLLSTSEHSLPALLAQSATYAFDVDTPCAHTAIALEELMKLSPEALSAMFDSMNGLAPAHAVDDAALDQEAPSEAVALTQNAPGPHLECAAPALDAAASSMCAAAPALETVTPALDVPAPALDAPALALDIPASATEESPGPLEGSLNPSSPSSSEGGSPPALSDDSGSSSRSSSVESDNDQDSLLMSPTALSADYSQLNNDLLSGKSSNVNPSQFQVEFGAVPGVTTADESSCASELLERYLNDQMTCA